MLLFQLFYIKDPSCPGRLGRMGICHNRGGDPRRALQALGMTEITPRNLRMTETECHRGLEEKKNLFRTQCRMHRFFGSLKHS